MNVKQILDSIRSNEIEVDEQFGLLDDETLYKYRLIKQILGEYERLDGFSNNRYRVLNLFYFKQLSVSTIQKKLGYKDERSIYRLKEQGIEELEKRFSRKAYPPRSGS